jgi:hypothetical protein
VVAGIIGGRNGGEDACGLECFGPSEAIRIVLKGSDRLGSATCSPAADFIRNTQSCHPLQVISSQIIFPFPIGSSAVKKLERRELSSV